MKKNICIALVLLLPAFDIYPNAMGSSYEVAALGGGTEYTRYFDDGKNRADALLSAKYGYIGFLSFLFSADAGYEPVDKNASIRLGIQPMILFFGFEGGVLSRYRSDDREYHPGGFAGLAIFYPWSDSVYVSSSSGVNVFAKKSENGFYARAGLMYNFASK